MADTGDEEEERIMEETEYFEYDDRPAFFAPGYLPKVIAADGQAVTHYNYEKFSRESRRITREEFLQMVAETLAEWEARKGGER